MASASPIASSSFAAGAPPSIALQGCLPPVPAGSARLAVSGVYRSGHDRNESLIARQAQMVTTCRTLPIYQLYAIRPVAASANDYKIGGMKIDWPECCVLIDELILTGMLLCWYLFAYA